MNKIFKNGLLMLAAGTFAVSCADYNDLGGFTAEPDPTITPSYNDLGPVKSYIDRAKYPNMTLDATLGVTDFNNQELAHAAAITNFDNLAFGTNLMPAKIINEKGVMNFLDMMNLLEHAEEIGVDVFGSPLLANANQADKWLKTLTAPIEIPVDFVEGKSVNFNDMELGNFPGVVEAGKATIVNYDNQHVLQISAAPKPGSVQIIDGFEVDPLAKYTITFYAKCDKDASFDVVFSGNKIEGTGVNGKWQCKSGQWRKIVVEAQSAEGVTEGYLRIDNTRTAVLNIQKVDVGYYPDNHRPQTAQELNDTIIYALNAWCDGFMKINEGRIKTFDLIDEPIDTKTTLEGNPDIFDLKHSTTDIPFWQDVLGSENYAPEASKVASAAFEKYNGDPAQLKFFISESGLDSPKKMESLKYWINIWDAKGAKIDGINAKLNLSYSEDEAKQAENVETLNTLLDNLAATGKMVRLSNFDIKYLDATGTTVSADKITKAQRQKLADYYGYVIKAYMSKIPNEKQAGLCKGNIVDTSEPVGLWSKDVNTNDWVRTATYKAFCDALAGK